jgi:hypothetical protein
MWAMETPSRSFTNYNLVFWLIALGSLAIWAGASDIHLRWSALVPGARICDLLIVTSGVLLCAAAVWILLMRRMLKPAALLGSAGAGLFAVTLLVGVWSGAIPCSGSS